MSSRRNHEEAQGSENSGILSRLTSTFSKYLFVPFVISAFFTFGMSVGYSLFDLLKEWIHRLELQEATG